MWQNTKKPPIPNNGWLNTKIGFRLLLRVCFGCCFFSLSFPSAAIRWAFDNNCEHVVLYPVYNMCVWCATKQTNRSYAIKHAVFLMCCLAVLSLRRHQIKIIEISDKLRWRKCFRAHKPHAVSNVVLNHR